jgi:hypothetical protein
MNKKRHYTTTTESRQEKAKALSYQGTVRIFHKLEQSHLLESLTLPKEETNRPLENTYA